MCVGGIAPPERIPSPPRNHVEGADPADYNIGIDQLPGLSTVEKKKKKALRVFQTESTLYDVFSRVSLYSTYEVQW